MLDLFGESITTPKVAQATKATVNLAEGFAEFWAIYPSGPRKVAKQQCLDKWAKYECRWQLALICKHVEWMKTQPDWMKDGGSFICAPLVYLNQQRWADWTPPAPRKADNAALLKIIADEKRATPMPAFVRDFGNKLKAQV